MFSRIQHYDFLLLQTINQKWSNPFFDAVIPWLRYQQLWYPFYVFLAALALLNMGKKAGWWILGAVVTIASCDMVSSRLFKKNIARLRPCNDPEVQGFITLRIPDCPGAYSFTSSHAANHFGLSMFLFITLRPIWGGRVAWIFAWAFAVCYAQLYVGAHYPTDVLGGGLIGCVFGYFIGRAFNGQWPLAPKN